MSVAAAVLSRSNSDSQISNRSSLSANSNDLNALLTQVLALVKDLKVATDLKAATPTFAQLMNDPDRAKKLAKTQLTKQLGDLRVKAEIPNCDPKSLHKDFAATLQNLEQLIGAEKLLIIQKELLGNISDPNKKPSDGDASEIHSAKIFKKHLLKAFAATQTGHVHKHAHGHDHDHSDGVVIDLDEAVHGVYASTKYIISALKGNPQHILDEFSSDAKELADHTWTYLRDELVPHGVGEFAAGVGVSAIMLPLAYMAAKAGLEEMHHASHEIKDLKKHQGKLKKIQGNLEKMNSILESKYLKTEAKVVDSKANVIQRAVKQSKRDWKIGLCSFGSGVSIGTKALSDIGLKISLGVQGLLTGKGFLGASQVISASTPTALVTTVLGAVGTFMMGPLAGLFATGLGAYFTRKSTSKRNQLKTDFEVAAGQLGLDPKTGKTQVKNTTDSNFQDFIGRQGKRRISFFKRFTRWNKAFMIGSGLYAASATTKAVVAGLALGGLTAAASNPIGLGVITAVGTIGALGMGIASYCFITGHGKQGKYSKHTAGDDKLVDRDLLVRAQAHAVDQNQSPDIEKQVKLATACLERLNARKDAIRGFLKKAAEDKNNTTKKKISPFLVTENGKKTDRAKKDKTQQLTLWKRLKGQRLSVKDVEKYLGPESNKIMEFARTDLEAEEKYLKAQLETVTGLIGQAKVTKFNENPTAENEKLSATQKFNNYTDAELTDKYEAIQARLKQTQDLINSISNTNTTNNYPIAKDLLQHWGVEAKEGKENHALADYLLDDVDKELRNARGVLFEAQLQASQLVKEIRGATVNTPPPDSPEENTVTEGDDQSSEKR